MSKVKLLSILVIILLLINVCIVFTFINQTFHPPQEQGPRNEIVRKLHFDGSQTEEYDRLIAKHRAAIRKEQTSMMQAKQQLYATLSLPSDSLRNDSLIRQINQFQKEIEYIHFNHFADIRSLCRPEQHIYFDELTLEIAELFSPHPPFKK